MTKQVITPSDYKQDEQQDWVKYLDQNFNGGKEKIIPFPNSNWNYLRKDSVFDQSDGLKTKDEVLHLDIMNKLYKSEKVDASLIKLDVLNGHVFIEGAVYHLTEREAVEKIVSEFPGVWMIISKIKILLPH